MSRITRTSEEEIALGERKNGRGLAFDEVPVDAYFVSFRIDFHFRRGAIVDESFFPILRQLLNGRSDFLQTQPLGKPISHRRAETNVMLVAAGALPKTPNIGR